MVVVCPKCQKLSRNPFKQTVRNKSGDFVYLVYSHLKHRQKTGAPFIKRCYTKLAIAS